MKNLKELKDSDTFAKTIVFTGKQLKQLENERLKIETAPKLHSYIIYKLFKKP
jgi:hypothetical protein